MKIRYFLCLTVIAAVCMTGCMRFSSGSSNNTVGPDGTIEIGNYFTAPMPSDDFALINNIDTLAADGLYYATWAAGSPTEYENSDGNIIDLYDASLYVLLSENLSNDKAQSSMAAWLSAARDNYIVENEDTKEVNGLIYTMITYQFAGEESPYARGISAFAAFDTNAVCIELTCTNDYNGDLPAIMEDFLKGCHYNTK